MFVIYYSEPKTNNRTWKKAETKEQLNKYIEDNDINDYEVTITESGYHALISKLERIKKQFNDLNDCFESVKALIDKSY